MESSPDNSISRFVYVWILKHPDIEGPVIKSCFIGALIIIFLKSGYLGVRILKHLDGELSFLMLQYPDFQLSGSYQLSVIIKCFKNNLYNIA